jgi:replicative DNA helicase
MEMALLGRLLVEPGALALCRRERLEARMFGSTLHGWMYGAMVDIDQRGDEIDLLTITNEMERSGTELEGLSVDYLTTLRDKHSAGEAVRTYAKEIRQLAEWRAMHQFGEQVQALAVARTGGSPTTGWSRVRKLTDDIRPYEPNANFTFGADTFLVYREMLADMQAHGTAFKQPFELLDKVYGMAQPGDMFGVIGGTGSGKSSVLATVAEFYAQSQGIRTTYIFTEMRLKKVLDRRMAKFGGLNYRRLKNPVEFTPGETALMVEAEEAIMKWAHKLDYWHAPSPTASMLMASMERFADELGTQIFVVDHMNDVNVVVDYGDTPSAWQTFFIDLESLCNRLGVILWTAAQMNSAQPDKRAYLIGQAFDNKMSVSMELQPQELKADLAFEYAGKPYVYQTGKPSPVVPVHFRKVRDESPARGELLFVGPRYLWVDVPVGFDTGKDDPGAFTGGRGAKD